MLLRAHANEGVALSGVLMQSELGALSWRHLTSWAGCALERLARQLYLYRLVQVLATQPTVWVLRSVVTHIWLALQYLLPQVLGALGHSRVLPSRSTQLPLPLLLAHVPSIVVHPVPQRSVPWSHRGP